uniref:Uncharacterized protein n=1 Tax=Romanomermis culicivorax TaxID=13658 RepID=A0A915K569_ROMCU
MIAASVNIFSALGSSLDADKSFAWRNLVAKLTYKVHDLKPGHYTFGCEFSQVADCDQGQWGAEEGEKYAQDATMLDSCDDLRHILLEDSKNLKHIINIAKTMHQLMQRFCT